jgi:16S rRNA (guanine527-N7)-methyltransferase
MSLAYDETVRSECRAAGIDVDPDTERRLAVYCAELDHWNRKINLTGLTGKDLVRRLVVDPLWVAGHLGVRGVVCDIGSGNGSPGIPICLTRPVSRMHFVESRTRRVAFLRHILGTLAIENGTVHKGRFEDVVSDIESVDWVTLQGVGPTEGLMEGIRLLTKPTTHVVWLTSVADPKVPLESMATTPDGSLKAVLLALDHS